MRRLFLAAILVANTSVAFAADHVVAQKDRRFHPGDIAIAKGDAVTFTNNDDFIHQIYVDNPVFNFDTAEKAPGESDTETFTQAGTFEVRCHIHPKMKLVVTVKRVPGRMAGKAPEPAAGTNCYKPRDAPPPAGRGGNTKT